MMAGTSLSSFVGLVISQFVLGIPLLSQPSLLDDLTQPEMLPVLRIMQVLQAIGFLILPSAFLIYLRKDNIFITPTRQRFMLSIVLVMVATPLINFLADWNAHLPIPGGFGDWIVTKEDNVAALTERFLRMPTLTHLISNIFMIAVLPAVAEELLFRGIVQRLLTNWNCNAHLAVWAAAILFSAIHVQFLGFVPRVLMGAGLGYLFLWSGNLWYPIIAHFSNNALAVVLSYLQQHGMGKQQLEVIGVGEPTLAMFSLAFCLVLLHLFKVVSKASDMTSPI